VRIRFDRIERAQSLMRQHNMLGIMVMNHDDYRIFSGHRGRNRVGLSRSQGRLC